MATTYPKVTSKAWSILRARAAAAPTTKLTPSVVASLLGMSSPTSARDNVVAPLRKLGLLEEDGSLTDLGNKWRVDSSYAEACDEILEGVYPEELASLRGESGELDAGKVKTWFDHKGFGESNARQMAATYVLIASREIPDPPGLEPQKKAASKQKSSKKTTSSPAKVAQSSGGEMVTARHPAPTVHLDIQIHIPADATAEQVDQIFASMAKHLYPD